LQAPSEEPATEDGAGQAQQVQQVPAQVQMVQEAAVGEGQQGRRVKKKKSRRDFDVDG